MFQKIDRYWAKLNLRPCEDCFNLLRHDMFKKILIAFGFVLTAFSQNVNAAKAESMKPLISILNQKQVPVCLYMLLRDAQVSSTFYMQDSLTTTSQNTRK